MTKSKIIIANWKLNYSLTESLAWCTKHKNLLSILTQSVELVICPDIVTAPALVPLLSPAGVGIGAQSAAPYCTGPYTGAVSARSLYEAGVTHVLIGHHEERIRSRWNSMDYATSCAIALEQGLTAIFCLGPSSDRSPMFESFEQFISGEVETLGHVCQERGLSTADLHKLCLAYEPVEAIGSGKLPTREILAHHLALIKKTLTQHLLPNSVRLLYGGGITSSTSSALKPIDGLDGLLVGSASLDIQNLKNIVYSFI